MCFYVTAPAPGHGWLRPGRLPAPRGHLQHPAKQPGHPHIEGGLNEGKCQPMVLLTKVKDKKAIAWDGGIGGAIAVPSTRLRLLLVCVEVSLG